MQVFFLFFFTLHCTNTASEGNLEQMQSAFSQMKRGHGDRALNLYLQEHQRVIQMNLCRGQGRWGEKHKDQKDSVWPEKDWRYLQDLIRTVGNGFELASCSLISLHLFSSTDLATDETKLGSQERRCKTSKSLLGKETSISLIRWWDTNTACEMQDYERCA